MSAAACAPCMHAYSTHLPSSRAVTQVPGGWAAQIYGGRVMLIISFVLWSSCSMLTPTDASHTGVIVVARVCIGVAQGFLIPSVHTVLSQVRTSPRTSRAHLLSPLLRLPMKPNPHRPLHRPLSFPSCSSHAPSQWIPPHERAKAVSLATSGESPPPPRPPPKHIT